MRWLSLWTRSGIPEEGDRGPAVETDSAKCASGGSMITVNLENDDQNDLFVSVTDLNRAGSPVVLSQVRINQAESLAVEIQEDGHGSGKNGQRSEWTTPQRPCTVLSRSAPLTRSR